MKKIALGQNRTRAGVDTWQDMGYFLNIRIKLEQMGKKGKRIPFSWFCPKVREKRKRRAKSFLPRFTKFCRSKFVGPRMKVHRIDEGYAWVPKTQDFAKDPNDEFRKSKVSGL